MWELVFNNQYPYPISSGKETTNTLGHFDHLHRKRFCAQNLNFYYIFWCFIMASSRCGFVRFQNCFVVQNLPVFWVNPINFPCCFNYLLVNLISNKSLGQKLKSVYICPYRVLVGCLSLKALPPMSLRDEKKDWC